MNRKGFTLVELLAVIAILGLLVTTVSIAVTKIYNDNVNKTMIVQNNKVKEAASIYLNDKCLLPLADAVCPDSYTEGQYICLEDLTENDKENYLTEVTYKNDKCSGIVVFEENSEGEKVEPVSYLFCGYDSSKNTFNYATNSSLDLSKYPRCNVKKNSSSNGEDGGAATTTTTSTTTTRNTTTTTTSTTTTTTRKISTDPVNGGNGTTPDIPYNCTIKAKNDNYHLVYCVSDGTGDSVVTKEKSIGICNNTSYCIYAADASVNGKAQYILYYNNNGTWDGYDLVSAVSNNIITTCGLVDLGYDTVCKTISAS